MTVGDYSSQDEGSAEDLERMERVTRHAVERMDRRERARRAYDGFRAFFADGGLTFEEVLLGAAKYDSDARARERKESWDRGRAFAMEDIVHYWSDEDFAALVAKRDAEREVREQKAKEPAQGRVYQEPEA